MEVLESSRRLASFVKLESLRATTVLRLVTWASSRAILLVEGLVASEVEEVTTVAIATVLGTEVGVAVTESGTGV